MATFFTFLRRENIVILRCLKLNENDNFDNKNWLLVIDDVMYDFSDSGIAPPKLMIIIMYINLGGNQLFKKKCQNQFGQGGIPPIRAMPKRKGVFPLEGFPKRIKRLTQPRCFIALSIWSKVEI